MLDSQVKCGSASTWMDHDLDGQRDSIPDQPRGQLTSRARLGVVLVNQTSSCSIQLEDMSEKVLGTVPQLWLNNALPNGTTRTVMVYCHVLGKGYFTGITGKNSKKYMGSVLLPFMGFKMTESFKMQIFKRSSQQIS